MAKKPTSSDSGRLPFPPPYVKKPPYFANKLIRLMAKNVLASRIGVEAAYLVATIAMQEDSSRYEGPVLFHWQILATILGLGSFNRFSRARTAACKAEWLIYVPAPNGTDRPGEYWTRLPDGITLDEDGYIGEQIETKVDAQLQGYAACLDDIKNGRVSITQNGNGSLTVSDTIAQNGNASEMLRQRFGNTPLIPLYISLPFTLSPKKGAAPPASHSHDPLMRKGTGKSTAKPKADVVYASTESPTAGITVPSELDCPEFHASWADWVQHRTQKKNPMTALAVKKFFKQCASAGVPASVAMIDRAIAGGWTGLFERETDFAKGSTNGSSAHGTTRVGGGRGLRGAFREGSGDRFTPGSTHGVL